MTRDRAATVVALAVAVGFALAAWAWRTGAVGGSDSACYALMAQVFAGGHVQPASALALEAPWPETTRVAAPAGFLPSNATAGAAVPVCAPGYSLLIAPLVSVAGPGAVHVVPPLAAALLVWLAFLLARRLHSPWAGVGAAGLVAINPIVLFQAVQPMNDITTGAVWLAAAVTALGARPLATGLLVGLGVLIRPNLAPAGAVAVLTVVWASARPFAAQWWPKALGAALVAGAATGPGVAAALVLNAALYGSPLQSGYGDLGLLFAAAHVPVNLAHYGHTWFVTSPLALLAVAAPWLVTGPRRAEAWALILLAGALSAVYLAYRPFPEWWYLRFLLPAVVLSLVLSAAVLGALLARLRLAMAVPVALVLATGVAGWARGSSEGRDALGLQALESRFPLTARVVADHFPPDAVAITVWQSGGLRFWPGREVIVWDALDPAWLDRTIAWLDERRRPTAIVIERWEEEGFRRRFAGQAFGALDWPPRHAVDRRVRVYLPEDRARYLRGEPVDTATVFAPR